MLPRSFVLRSLVPLAALATVSCGPPKNYTPVDQIPSLPSLKDVMDVQATTADPQFKKTGADSFSEDDWAQLKEASKKIEATSKRIKSFSKGPEFDALADRLGTHASELEAASEKKDAAGAKAALTEMKATCKECHSRFR